VQRRTVVIVDDSEDSRDLVTFALGRRGWRVIGAESAFDLSAILAKEQPELVLLDVQMPAINGDKVARMLTSAAYPHLHRCPLVLYSGLDDAKLAELAQGCGAAGWIRKDTVADELARRVDELTTKR
jgi:two-component system OmpR family response regulator